jgi:RNA polymerase sigma-70 factor (ECF subfamily)
MKKTQLIQTPRVSQDSLPDETVIARVLGGEKELYELIIRRYDRRLFRISRSYVKDGDEAEDVVQEAFIRAYENLAQFEGRSAFSTWLTRILLNEALSRTRRHRRFPSFRTMPDPFEPQTTRMEIPEERVMNDELRNKLPEKYRVVYVMREIEAMSTAETGESLGITEANVKVRLNRAKAQLRRHIGRTYRVLPAYEFDLVRCDRIVANVLARVGRYEGVKLG